MSKQPTIISMEEGVRKLNYSSLIRNIQNEHCQKELQRRVEPFLAKQKGPKTRIKKIQRDGRRTK